MKATLAVLAGFLVWLAIFMIGQYIGFAILDVEPGSIASQALVAFVFSIVGAQIADLAMVKVHSTLSPKVAYSVLGTLIAAMMIAVFILGSSDHQGQIFVTAATLLAALLPMIHGYRQDRLG